MHNGEQGLRLGPEERDARLIADPRRRGALRRRRRDGVDVERAVPRARSARRTAARRAPARGRESRGWPHGRVRRWPHGTRGREGRRVLRAHARRSGSLRGPQLREGAGRAAQWSIRRRDRHRRCPRAQRCCDHRREGRDAAPDEPRGSRKARARFQAGWHGHGGQRIKAERRRGGARRRVRGPRARAARRADRTSDRAGAVRART